MSERPAVGFIGLGLMGGPMAKNILNSGFPLTVYNRTRARTAALAEAGARVADSPGALAAQVDFVCSCITGPQDVAEVYLGDDGVVANARPGAVLVEMSTIDPGTHRQIAAAAAARGVDYLDAPVSGGVTGAEDGTLAIMTGAEPEVFERAKPVLDAMGENIVLMGPVGSGAVAKLINNMMAAISNAGIAEGMVIGAKCGLDAAQLQQVLMASAASSFMLRMLPDFTLRRNFEPGFTIDNQTKDVNLATDLARDLGVPTMLGAVAAQLLRTAQAEGLGDRHIAAVIQPLERLTGVEVGGE